MRIDSTECGPRPRTKLAAYLLSNYDNDPERLLGLEIVIARKNYRLTSYRIIELTGETIATLHSIADWRDVIHRSLHLF